MTNTDSFISEVTEEVRRDRLFRLFRRYSWIGVAAIILLVAGAAFNEWRKAQIQTAAETFGDGLRAATSEEDTHAALTALSNITANGDQRALIALTKAHILAAAGDDVQSIDELAMLAADQEISVVYRHLAELKIIWAQSEQMSLDEQFERLVELEKPGAPFRLLANETRAHALIKAGQFSEAKVILERIQEEAAVPQDLRLRVAQLLTTFEADSNTDSE